MRSTLLLAAAAALALVPLAAPPAQASGDCVVVDTLQDGTYYTCDDGTVWLETNGLLGLQRTWTSIPSGEIPPDTQVVF